MKKKNLVSRNVREKLFSCGKCGHGLSSKPGHSLRVQMALKIVGQQAGAKALLAILTYSWSCQQNVLSNFHIILKGP